MRPFEPLLRNPHVLTVLGNFWPRKYDFGPYPLHDRLVQTDPDTQVLVQTQTPSIVPAAEVVLLHGLEGSGEAGYIRSMAWDLLQNGFIAHRFHMRTCGNTENLCKTLYHAGLTSDLHAFLEQLRAESDLPVLLCGFSLGGNVALKLAGELGETDLIQGVCAISTPIDLAMGVRRIGQRDNRLYENRFLERMRERLLATGRYTREELAAARTLYEIDDRITAPSFGFGNADNYYATQSAKNFLARIRVPTLMIQAKDDTFIPFEMYERPEIWTNPHLKLVATEAGGHLGFLSRRGPRFWVDEVVVDFITQTVLSANMTEAANVAAQAGDLEGAGRC
jgi:predicted alpha/beta-fold hydrolase